MSGNPKVAQIDAIKKGLAKAGDMVQSYNYVMPDATNGQKVMTMQVRFSPKLVNELLQQGNQAALPKSRPLTLVWLAIVNAPNQQPTIVSDSKNAIVATMQSEANKAALPLLWPSMDLQDVSAVSATQVASLDQTAVQNASQRYQADGILIGKIVKQSPTSWQAQWLLIRDQGNQSWQTQGSTPTQAAVAVLPQLGGVITTSLTNSATPEATAAQPVAANDPNSQQQASQPGAATIVNATPATQAAPVAPINMNSAQAITLQIIGINGLDDYAGLVDYFHSLDVVGGVNVLQTQGEQLTVKLQLKGTADQLFKEIAQGNKLTAQTGNSGQMPVYYWTSVHPAQVVAPQASMSPAPVASQSAPVQSGTMHNDAAPIVSGVPLAPNQQANAYPPAMPSDHGDVGQTFPVNDDSPTFAPENNPHIPEEVTP